jgi:hypothetical protein
MNYSICQDKKFETEHQGVKYICYITSFWGNILKRTICVLNIRPVTNGDFYKFYFSSLVKYGSSKRIGDNLWYNVDFVKSLIPLAVQDKINEDKKKAREQEDIKNAKHLNFI